MHISCFPYTHTHINTQALFNTQDELLHSSGLGPETLGLNPEQVEQSLKVKLGQIQEDT